MTMKKKVKHTIVELGKFETMLSDHPAAWEPENADDVADQLAENIEKHYGKLSKTCLLYTSPSPRDRG